jgi:hypothetical protein
MPSPKNNAEVHERLMELQRSLERGKYGQPTEQQFQALQLSRGYIELGDISRLPDVDRHMRMAIDGFSDPRTRLRVRLILRSIINRHRLQTILEETK